MMPNLNDLMQFRAIVAPDALTALYARLSVDDANDGDSNSIVHQKEMHDATARTTATPTTSSMWMTVSLARTLSVLTLSE